MIEIYTDGSCAFNPGGRGAWAFVLYENGQKKTTQSGVEETTTSNRMEIMAIYKALEWVKFYYPRSEIKIYSDSILAVNCFNEKWQRKSNRDLWDKVEKIMPQETLFSKADPNFRISFYWVKGHADCEGNNEADRIANKASNLQGVYMPKYSYISRGRKVKKWDIHRKPWLKQAKF